VRSRSANAVTIYFAGEGTKLLHPATACEHAAPSPSFAAILSRFRNTAAEGIYVAKIRD
jgi:hypothetical protein